MYVLKNYVLNKYINQTKPGSFISYLVYISI